MGLINNFVAYLFPYTNKGGKKAGKEVEGNLCLVNGSLHIKRDPRYEIVGDVSREKTPFDLGDIEDTIRDVVCELNAKGIYTYYSEAGGKGHSIEDFAYVVTRLTPKNADITEKNRFLLKSIYNCRDPPKIFNYADRNKTNFYVLGFNRKNLNDREVSNKFSSLVSLLGKQEDDLKERGSGFRKDEKQETAQYLSIMNYT